MAAFDSPQPSRFSISDCPVCLDAYHPQERIPRLLKTCGHTFCEPCLVKLRLSTSPSPVVKCPCCRRETKVEDKDPFPKNYALLETIEQAQQLSVQHQAVVNAKKCDRCSNQPAEFGCGECPASLCGKCWGKIHSVGFLRSHTQLDCSEVVQITCPDHPSKTADLICLEKTCASYETPICLLCERTELHKGHSNKLIEQVANEKRKELKQIIEKAQNSVNFALTVMVQVQETDELLHGQVQENIKKGIDDAPSEKDGSFFSNRNHAIRLIDDTFNALFEALTQRKNSLIQQVDALVNDKATKLEEQRVELSTFLSRSYAHLQEATRVLKKSNDHQFMSAFRALYDPLVKDSQTELFPQPVITPLIDLSFPEDLTPLIQEVGVVKDDGLVSQIKRSANEFHGIFVSKFGYEGSGNGLFNYPVGATFSPEGLLYISDCTNHRIQVFRSDGTFVRNFGHKGSADGQLNSPTGITFDSNGLVYICDQNNHRIQVFRSDGTFVRKFGSQGSGDGQLSQPFGITLGSDGLLYLTEWGNHRIQVFRTDGSFVRKFGSNGSADGQFSNPSGSTFGPDGLLYVAECENHRIHVLRTDGTFVSKFGSRGSGDGQFSYPNDIKFHDGLLYVSDFFNDRIQVLRSDGTFVRKFGSEGSDDGQFQFPCAIAFNDDKLYVSDRNNHRIQVFR